MIPASSKQGNDFFRPAGSPDSRFAGWFGRARSLVKTGPPGQLVNEAKCANHPTRKNIVS